MKHPFKAFFAASAAILFSVAAMAAETQLVNATGYGMSVEEAQRAGVRAAVEAVVGTLVDAETLVENDQLVQDKILSYSAGMVDDVKIIGVPKKNSAGLVMVRVQVKVRKTALVERVKAVTRSDGKVDAESLYHQVLWAQQTLNDAHEIMKSLFKAERMQGLLHFEPDMDKGSSVSIDPTTGELFVAVKGGVNLQVYHQWISEIIAKLEPMATKKREGRVEDGDLSQSFMGFMGNGKEPDVRHLCILVNHQTKKGIELTFDKGKSESLEEILGVDPTYEPTLKVALIDKFGNEMRVANKTLEWMFICSNWGCRYEVFPFFRSRIKWKDYKVNLDSCLDYKLSVSMGVLTLEEVRNIDHVSVEVILKKAK